MLTYDLPNPLFFLLTLLNIVLPPQAVGAGLEQQQDASIGSCDTPGQGHAQADLSQPAGQSDQDNGGAGKD